MRLQEVTFARVVALKSNGWGGRHVGQPSLKTHGRYLRGSLIAVLPRHVDTSHTFRRHVAVCLKPASHS